MSQGGKYQLLILLVVFFSTLPVINAAFFSYTGSLQTFSVPTGTYLVQVELWGAGGGGRDDGGK